MVLRTDSMPVEAKPEEKTGEVRRDSEGKGYFYEFKKNEKKAKVEVKKVVKKKKEEDFDINGDGKVDKKDTSLAAKILRKSSRRSKK